MTAKQSLAIDWVVVYSATTLVMWKWRHMPFLHAALLTFAVSLVVFPTYHWVKGKLGRPNDR